MQRQLVGTPEHIDLALVSGETAAITGYLKETPILSCSVHPHGWSSYRLIKDSLQVFMGDSFSQKVLKSSFVVPSSWPLNVIFSAFVSSATCYSIADGLRLPRLWPQIGEPETLATALLIPSEKTSGCFGDSVKFL